MLTLFRGPSINHRSTLRVYIDIIIAAMTDHMIDKPHVTFMTPSVDKFPVNMMSELPAEFSRPIPGFEPGAPLFRLQRLSGSRA